MSAASTVTVVSLLPRLLDTNGDAGNARVLAQRARWAGLTADVVAVHTEQDLPGRVDLVSIGSGTDTDLILTRDALAPFAGLISGWLAAGVPVLAVGTGWELLSDGVDLPDGTHIDGLGVVAGRAVPLPARATDDLVVTGGVERLIGFENHARGYRGGSEALGSVGNSTGTGNGDGTEGTVAGTFIGTHLHGPVLARNPCLADRMLHRVAVARGFDVPSSVRAQGVDDIALAARNQVAARLGLPTE